jgi:hypothetical protein
MSGKGPVSLPSEGWAVEISGNKIDLNDLRQSLPAGGEPWVEDYSDPEKGDVLLLRSENWKEVEHARTVVEMARVLIRRLNAVQLLAHDDAEPVSFAHILKFRADGSRDSFILTGTAAFRLGNVRARGAGAAVNSKGVQQPSSVQRWLARSASDSLFAELLDYIARADDWFELYKATEVVESLIAGKNEAEKLRKLGTYAKNWKLLTHTANSIYRHAASRFAPPAQPMALGEAKSLLVEVVRTFFPA